jgi:type VI secretion system secreted protein VgrG
MPPKKANQAQFYFFCGKLPSETFEVMNFSGIDTVSSIYKFSMMLISQRSDILPDEIVNKAGTLYIYRDGEYYPYSGIVSEFRFLGKSLDRTTYALTLVSRLWLLNMNVNTRIFQKSTALEILTEVLDATPIKGHYKLQLDQGNYSPLEYVVQYQESDLNFIARFMEANGIWYFFNENPVLTEELDGSCGAEGLIIADKASSFEFIPTTPDILFRTLSGMAEQIEVDNKESVHGFEMFRQIVPKEVLLKDFNYRTPEIDLKSRKPVKTGDIGTVYQYGGHFKNITEAEKNAEIASNRLAVQKIVMEGSSNCRGMRAAKRFTLQEHFLDSLNGKYVITQVHHQGSHTMEGDSANVYTYVNRFSCIPAAQADIFRPQCKAMLPRIHGIMTSSIEANGSNYASIDDMGRYKVRMPFDLSSKKNYEASRYMRLAQPYSGSNYGMHFPSHEGAEMVWACIDGDPDRPLGLSTVPNANKMSPVVSSNKQQNIIKTAGGNQLLLDDTDAKQKAILTTTSQHKLEMDDENKCVTLKSSKKNTLFMDDKNEYSKLSADKHTITMTYKSGSEGVVITTGGGHVINIDDKNKKLTIQTKAGNLIEMDDNGKKIGLTDAAGKNKVTLDGNGGKLLLDSQGEITINATKDLIIKAANIKMTSQGKIEAKATGDFTLAGMKISAKADMDAEIKGTNLKLEGQMNATLKGGIQTKVEGTMTEVAGSAMTKVKGGIVMIN